jgi:hypothetical protein
MAGVINSPGAVPANDPVHPRHRAIRPRFWGALNAFVATIAPVFALRRDGGLLFSILLVFHIQRTRFRLEASRSRRTALVLTHEESS